MNDKALNAIRDLLAILIKYFGPGGTVVIFAVVFVGLFGFRVYRDHRSDRMIQKALEEKERTIQRLANQERTWRRLFLTKGIKLDPHEANKLLSLEQDFENPKQSRTAVETKRKSQGGED